MCANDVPGVGVLVSPHHRLCFLANFIVSLRPSTTAFMRDDTIKFRIRIVIFLVFDFAGQSWLNFYISKLEFRAKVLSYTISTGEGFALSINFGITHSVPILNFLSIFARACLRYLHSSLLKPTLIWFFAYVILYIMFVYIILFYYLFYIIFTYI